MSDANSGQYATAPVPEEATVPGWRVGLIVASFSVALPAFLYGAESGLALGLRQAVLAALLGGIIICAGGSVTALVSVRTRLTTYLLVQRSFGQVGAGLVNLVMALVQLGWFGVNVSFFGDAVLALVDKVYGAHVQFAPIVIAGSVLMTISTAFGFRMLEKLALITVPLLAIAFGAVCIAAIQRHGIALAASNVPPVPMTFGVAVSALIGGNMVAIATMPDLTRFIRTTRGAVGAMGISYPIAAPLVTLVAALTALATGKTDIMALIVAFGFGAPALLLVIFSSWTLNALNLYSASLSLSATFPKIPPVAFTLAGGAIGAAFAVVGIINAFVPFLLALGLVIPPIAAIYVIDVLAPFGAARMKLNRSVSPTFSWPAITTWIGSVAIVVPLEYYGHSLTGVSTLDSTIVAAAAYSVVCGIRVAKYGKNSAIVQEELRAAGRDGNQ